MSGIERTTGSWVIFALRKLGFFTKAGVAILTLLFFVLEAVATYLRFDYFPKSLIEIVNMTLDLVVTIQVLTIPAAIYVIGRDGYLRQENLSLPPYKLLIILPLLAKICITTFIMIDIIKCRPIQGAIHLFISIATVTILTLPNVVSGITTASFNTKCQLLQTNHSTEPRKKANQLLSQFRSIKNGCGFILFTVFAGNTLLGIGVGYLIVMQITGCMIISGTSGFIYATFLTNAIMFLIYFGLIMEDCCDEFQATADILRS